MTAGSSIISPEERDRIADEEHLRLVSIFHYVAGGLHMLLFSVPILHLVLLQVVMKNPKLFTENGNAQPPPPELISILTVLVVCLILAGWTFGILTMVSGKLIAKRRARTFSIVIAALNCAIFPFGTTLGVFALVVLLRRTVRDIYAGHSAARPT